MTKDKFRELCEHVLIPRLGNLMHQQLMGVHEELGLMASELIRLSDRLDRIVTLLDGPDIE